MVAIGGSEGSRGGVQKAHYRTKEISTSEKEGEVIRSHELINGQEARRDHHLARAGQRGLGRGQRYHRVYGSENASSKGSVCSSFTCIDLHSSLHSSLFTLHINFLESWSLNTDLFELAKSQEDGDSLARSQGEDDGATKAIKLVHQQGQK